MSTQPNDALRRLLCARHTVLEKALELLAPDSATAAEALTLPTESSKRLDLIANEITGELLLLRAVLEKIDDGTFVQCTELGNDITEARLQAYACGLLCAAGVAPADCAQTDAECLSQVDEKIDEWQRSLRSA